ncbi:hypothetical protein NDU88_001528 [Pleurodeles waltl]|uniref:Regulator of G-protein signaling 12 n=1 Tax=Pleurodeles waltl TaxID=8319 RepID=A0AAV7WKS7_PLEWA|nr:hypothetical protein NDU88_001528 [Pleurodeles waltl]
MPTAFRIRSVAVARGRAGYGFTVSGQSPCVLNCVMKGSPADYVGLKAGDQIVAVNEISVNKASYEDVVKLIGQCSGVLHMVIAEGTNHIDTCSSDDEVGFYEGKGCMKPKLDSKTLGINRAQRVVEEMQSGGIFNMIFENPSVTTNDSETSFPNPRPLSAPNFEIKPDGAKQNPELISKEEISRVLNDNSVFINGLENPADFELDASILNVGMIVGYLGSIELPSTSSNLEYDSLQAIRGCMRRLRAEQKIHSLVLMKIMHDCVQLCTDKAGVVAVYPSEKLAFSAVCPDDRRFFGLVTMQTSDDASLAQEDECALRTSCHVFMVDPELFNHKIHQGIARRFGFECTADPDTNGCLEFPPSSLPVLQFISVLYRDMGEMIEGMRARAFLDGDADAQQNNSTSSNSDSGIGNFNQEEKSNRVLVVDLGGNPNKHAPSGIWDNPLREQSLSAMHWNGYSHGEDDLFPLEGVHADKPQNVKKPLGPAARIEVPLVPSCGPVPHSRTTNNVTTGPACNQRWLPVHVLKDWQHGNISDQESYADSTDGWSSVNCGTLPPPMNKIPADRYRVEGNFGQPATAATNEDWSNTVFGVNNGRSAPKTSMKTKGDTKSAKFEQPSGLTQAPKRSSARRSFGRSKRIISTCSLDDLESAAVSDGELNNADLKGCISDNSLSSHASLPSVQSCRRLGERRVASWAVCFERLLQDPFGVKYFSEFLKKEFSEENILFWQACEYFSRIPAQDKKELSFRAREIFSKYLCSKATTPVNIDSQAQLADDILNAPHPDMFKEQQLQIFNLMKFDSYTRFLKSYLYQECMLAEVEGRCLPDPQQIPSSPVSKHSISSDRSNISTPKKLNKKTKSGRSLNEESGDDDVEKKKKAAFFSWSRSKSVGKSQKKKENGDFQNDFIHSNGVSSMQHDSQDSLSSTASLELLNCGSQVIKPEAEVSRLPLSNNEKEKSSKHCFISLPDGSSCTVVVKSGFSIKDVLCGLCEKHGINIAAVDLFLAGGSKPLVLSQDSSILDSRDLRLERRTLFRLDLIPINRSVGLKAKPTKPVTEVLRPVVAKYGLNLNELVVRLSGEQAPLDLGVPISCLDGQRVILAEKDGNKSKDKQKSTSTKPNTVGEERTLGKSSSIRLKGENAKTARDVRILKRDDPIAKMGRRTHQKINLDEAEEFFELISKAQSNRAEDQRGLLRKEDLVLPEFLRLVPGEPTSSTPSDSKTSNKRLIKNDPKDRTTQLTQQHGKLESSQNCTEYSTTRLGHTGKREKTALLPPNKKTHSAPFSVPLSPIPHLQESTTPRWERHSRDFQTENIQTIDDDNIADLTLVAEGDITSPNSTLLPPPPTPPSNLSKLVEANYPPPSPLADNKNLSGCQRSTSGVNQRKSKSSRTAGSFSQQTSSKSRSHGSLKPDASSNPAATQLSANQIFDVDGVKLRTSQESEGNLSFDGYMSELRSCQGRMRTGVYKTSDLPSMVTAKTDKNKKPANKYQATFV